jgi:hypothetical protein
MNIVVSISEVMEGVGIEAGFKVIHRNIDGKWTYTFFSSEKLGGETKEQAYKFYRNQLAAEYAELYDLWTSQGLSKDRVVTMLEALPAKELTYSDNVNKQPIGAQKHYILSELEEAVGWSGLSDYEKRKTLYKLGINTKKGNYYYTDRLVFSNNKHVYTTVVYGDERSDKAWESGNHSSEGIKTLMWEKRHGLGNSSGSGYSGVDSVMN